MSQRLEKAGKRQPLASFRCTVKLGCHPQPKNPPPPAADLEPVVALLPSLPFSPRAFRGFTAPLPASSAKRAALPARLRRPRLAVVDSEAWRGVDWADDLLPRGLANAWERG